MQSRASRLVIPRFRYTASRLRLLATLAFLLQSHRSLDEMKCNQGHLSTLFLDFVTLHRGYACWVTVKHKSWHSYCIKLINTAI